MRVYLAAPYVAREQVKEYAAELARIGYDVTSSWLDETHEINAGTAGAGTSLADADVAKRALTDLHDINKSHLLVLFTQAALGLDGCAGHSGGRHVETGFALAMQIPVVVVGESENVFHRIGNSTVVVVPDWHQAVVELSARLVSKVSNAPRAVQEASA